MARVVSRERNEIIEAGKENALPRLLAYASQGPLRALRMRAMSLPAMPVPAGTLFGPYELVAPLGAGGMGEVFRARDPRLLRDVAIKILRTDALHTPERVRRFEQEARAVGALNHPNVLAVFDVGTQDGKPFVVTELLEGETLRARIDRAPFPSRRAVDVAAQIAHGLAAAHEKGIVHRDLKPENIFLTRDGRAKILDFGLAKLLEQPVSSQLTAAPAQERTEPGVVLGTAGYMAPEQVRGEAADGRADIFALGALLYEMLTGRRAFAGDTRIAILYGIVHADPPELDTSGDPLKAGLDAVLRHCLEKHPEERFQSARDLAFQLEQLAAGTSGTSGRMRAVQAQGKTSIARRLAIVGSVLALGAGLAAGLAAGTRLGKAPAPRYRQLTFRRGVVRSARFAPDGQTVVYAAAFNSEPLQLYATPANTEGVESRPLGLPAGDLFSISPAGELALGLRLSPGPSSFVRSGTLARVPLAGGAPRELAEHVHEADWAGDDLAVIRQVEGKYRIELRSVVLAETRGWFSHLRVAPRGDRIAFIDHPLYGDDRGAVALVDLRGNKRTLSTQYTSAQGLAWHGDGEIWFTAGDGIARALREVTDAGRERVLVPAPATLSLFDVSRDGRVLLGRETARAGLQGRLPDGTERDLSWLDFSVATGFSRESSLFSFFEAGEGGGALGTSYVRKLDGTPAIKLGAGYAWDLTQDGRTAVLFSPAEPGRLRLVPTRAGDARTVDLPLEHVTGARFLPGGDRLVVSGNEKGRGTQLFVSGDGPLRAFTPEGIGSLFYTVAPISPDGARVVAQDQAKGTYAVYPLDGGAPVPLALDAAERPQGWADSRSIYVQKPRELPVRVDRLDLVTGQRTHAAHFSPADPAGIEQVGPVFLDETGTVILYGYVRTLSELYIADGIR